ncbi:NAD(P)H-dependent oxidoreductase [Candidatus Uhrbacteria bacterium]|nr:NAD(P)H-dependent oxidoreductase [Candidatus Uhrbacteria bacterium]
MFHHKKNRYPSITLIQGSLHPASHTAILLDAASRILSARNVAYSLLDLRAADLDLCDGRAPEGYGLSTRDSIEMVKKSDVIFFGIPAYAAQAPGPLKNVISLTEELLNGKRAGLICFSEKGVAYEASLDLMSQLTDAGVRILKPVVLVSKDGFRGKAIFDDVVLQLLEELVDAALKA